VIVNFVSYAAFSLTYVVIFAVAALGVNLQYGYAGLFNVGVAGFFAIGAYASAILTGPHWAGAASDHGWPVTSGIVAATVVSGVAAWVVGLAVLALGGDYLAIATFGIGVSIEIAAINGGKLTGGPSGISGIARPLREGSIGLGGNAAWLGLCAAVLALVWWMLERATATPWGRSLRALSEDATAAAGMGKPVARFRLEAFVVGSALCGLSGALYAHFVGFISPLDFVPILTFQIYAMVIIGGVGRHAGAVLGTFVVWETWSVSGMLLALILPPEWQASAGSLRVVVIALFLLVILLARPTGILGNNPARLR
jgi:branched-chain amino acid transport system permease protein